MSRAAYRVPAGSPLILSASAPKRHANCKPQGALPSGIVREVRIVGEGVFWYNTPNGLMSLQGVPTAAGAEDGMPSKNRSLRMAVLDEFDV